MTVRTRRRVADWRGLLVRDWDHRMQRWRIQGHLYPFEEFLRSGADVVVGSGRLADALAHAGLHEGRFGHDGPDADRVWLLGADDTLALIEDHHVADMEQREFDALVEGLGASRWRCGGAYDPAAAVERHAEWTRQISVAIKGRRK